MFVDKITQVIYCFSDVCVDNNLNIYYIYG